MYVCIYRVQNVFLRCPTPRLHCFLSSHWPSFMFLSFMAFFIPSIQFYYAVRHLDSTASYLPTGLHFGLFRSCPSLYFPSNFSSVFLVLSFVSASTSMLFCAVFLLPFFVTWPYHVNRFCSISSTIVSSSPICCLIVTFLILSFLDILEDLLRPSISVASTRPLLFSVSLHVSAPSYATI